MTRYHAKYWANALLLKRSSHSIENLSKSIANARVDLNPHQVHAALFALESPLSRGVLLADEVGLGKTIEAGLVLAQKWAEQKRHILLIVPAFLQKQWEQELQEKFSLPCRILDSKSVASDNPFDSGSEILICSYQFAANRAAFLSRKWDLVVCDEAHRLRNVYKKANKQAQAIADALTEAPKILLTATPLQNNLKELFGLIQVIDPYVFGDERSFQHQFMDEDSSREELKRRIKPFVNRTLRKQVSAYILFPKRIAFTHSYRPGDDEQELYEGVSAYLQRADLAAFPGANRKLITLLLRKLLASSSFAIANTLEAVIQRLEREAGPQHVLEEMDPDQVASLDEELKETLSSTLPDPEIREQQAAIRREAAELRQYLELARKINRNSKADSLLAALKKALDKAEELGAAPKAVIFTESTRTQAYLYKFLSENGYKDKIVRINGSNADPDSKAFYEEWLQTQGDTLPTASKPVLMKAALVDAFKKKGTLLIATEAAAEGLNLQFCSIVINYDLPWNPQRVEQRIGRCHRYGQKHDVIVVNFVNSQNAADQRVFQLLHEKFHLFDGIFGASDDILGAIESGVDIEKRILDIYQTCRTSEEIQASFDALQAELEEEIQANLDETHKKLQDHFDQDVTALFKDRKESAGQSLTDREQWLSQLLTFEHSLPPGTAHFQFPNTTGKFSLSWKLAQAMGIDFLREQDPIPQAALHAAVARETPSKLLRFDYTTYPHKISAIEPFVGQSGWLQVSKLQIRTLEAEEHLLFTGMTDMGIPLDPTVCEKLFLLSAEEHPIPLPASAPSFDPLLQATKIQLTQAAESRAQEQQGYEIDKFNSWADDKVQSIELDLKELDIKIKQTEKALRESKTLEEKLKYNKQVWALKSHRSDKRKAIYDEEDAIKAKRDSLISAIESRLETTSEINTLFTIRWAIA